MTKSGKKPGKIACFLLESVLPKNDSYYLIGDFEEEFSSIHEAEGTFAAHLMFWRLILVSLPGFLSNSIYWSMAMFKSYFKIAFRNIQRQKGYSFINVFGLGIGMACTLIITLWVINEISWDEYHENADKIYRVAQEFPYTLNRGNNKAAISPAPLAQAMVQDLTEVESAVRFYGEGEALISHGDKQFIENRFFYADPELFDIFSFCLKKGNPELVLGDPFSIILSESMVSKYFSNKDPIGQSIRLENKYDFHIVGIFEDFPTNSHFKMDFIAPFETIKTTTNLSLERWGQSANYTYVLLHPEADYRQVNDKFTSLLAKYWNEENAENDRYFLQPLTKIHLHSNLGWEIETNGNFNLVLLLSVIGFIVLILACINYMNLATARSSTRMREVGIRKVFGADRKQLFRQFMGESVIFTFLGIAIAILILIMILPAFNQFAESDLNLKYILNGDFLVWLVILMLFVTVGAGCYPALVLSSFKPISIFGSQSGSMSRGRKLKNLLVLFQSSVSIVLIICTLIIRNQIQFVQNKDLGYAKDQIVVIELKDRDSIKDVPIIKKDLLQNANILSVSSSNSLPNRMRGLTIARWPGKPKDVEINIRTGTVDYGFVDLYDIEIVDGRSFSLNYSSDDEGAFLLNESAVKALGWESPIGREMNLRGHFGSGKGRVVGIMKDFHSESLRHEIIPLQLFLDANKEHRFLSVKIMDGHIQETISFLHAEMEKFSPQYPVEFTSFSETFDKVYRTEQKMEYTLTVFSTLALLIACLGLFGLASFTTSRRVKEIGIRKVLGASDIGVVALLSKEFVVLVLLSNAIAWPLAYFVMKTWQENYAYNYDISFHPFILAGITTLAVTLITVSFQAFKAALSNPVDSLRHE